MALEKIYTKQFFDGEDEKGDLTISTILDCQMLGQDILAHFSN